MTRAIADLGDIVVIGSQSYAHGGDAATAILPVGWQDRLVLLTGEICRLEHVRN